MKFSVHILTILWVISLSTSHAQSSSLAYEGYDATTYFNASPQKGNQKFVSTYHDKSFLFTSAANKKKFDSNPTKYVAQYDGWCAYAMGLDGSKVEINPLSYKILNGKLFYKKGFVDTKDKWNKNEETLLKNADKNWAKQ